MSSPRRVVEDGTYHVTSRIVNWGSMLTPEERTRLLDIMKRSAEFCGVELKAWCVMPNHFHALVHVPPARKLSDDEYVARYAAWRGEKEARELALSLDAGLKRRLFARMYDLSKFMQLAKKWYTESYNSRLGHMGTLWSGKFSSVLVEDDRVPMTNVAAYIDLNPVRNGMVSDAGEYAWSSFGEASQLHEFAQSQYAQMYGVEKWREAAALHRETMAKLVAVLSKRDKKLRAIGKLAAGEHACIRAFTDGVAVGSAAFVERYFAAHAEDFPASRKSGTKRIAGFKRELCALRELR